MRKTTTEKSKASLPGALSALVKRLYAEIGSNIIPPLPDIISTVKIGPVRIRRSDLRLIEKVLFWMFAILPLIMADLSTGYIDPLELNATNLKYIIFYTLIPNLFTLCWVGLMVYFCWAILPKLIGKVVYVLLVTIWGTWLFANYISYCMFGRFLLFKSIFLAGEGMDYISVIPKYITLPVVIFITAYILSAVMALKLWQRPLKTGRVVRYGLLAIPIVGIIAIDMFMRVCLVVDKTTSPWLMWVKPTIIYEAYNDSNKAISVSGLYQYTFKSAYRMTVTANKATEEEIKAVDDYFAEKEFTENKMTGIFEGKNVIVVLMESIDDWMIDSRYTPTIKYMMDNGINFTNHYMPCWGNGYTFNSEFAVNTGFNCPSTEVSASAYPDNSFPSSLARAMTGAGYNAKSFHFNSPTFYNRGVIHPKTFGYEEYVAYIDYMPKETYSQDSLNIQDDTLYNEMIRGGEEPFMNYMVTYSAHLPYARKKNDTRLTGILDRYPEYFDPDLPEEEAIARVLAHDTDEFFRILLQRLKEDGLLSNTVIIGFTDHHSYGINDTENLQMLSDQMGNVTMEQVPFFIWTPRGPRMKVTKPTGALNILPTIKNVMGIDNSKYCMGYDAFDPDYTGLVYFPDGIWITDKMYYSPASDTEYTEEELEYIGTINNLVHREMQVNDIVVKSDYFNNYIDKNKRR